MNQVVENSLRWIACLVACWLPLQPIIASNCQCPCFDTATSKTCDDDCSGCGHHHDSDEREQPERQKRSRRTKPMAPCDCPPTCPCQGQHHSPPQASTERSEQVIRLEIAEGKNCTDRNQGRCQQIRQQFDANDFSTGPGTNSALQRCAELCRFLI